EEHGIELSYTFVQKALQGAGLVARGRKRRKHRRRRERRPMPGMLLHIDGSKHQWFGDERWYDLIVILDDATSEIYYAQLVEEERVVAKDNTVAITERNWHLEKSRFRSSLAGCTVTVSINIWMGTCRS